MIRRYVTPEIIGLMLIALAAVTLRLWGIEERTFSHPENFVSGIKMPEWVNQAANRTDWDTLYKGTLADGHPPGYFLFMFGWTKTFGTSLLALRLPSAIFGVLTVVFVYLIAKREADQRSAFFASLFLALSGFHIYWSQMTRMYVMAALLCVIATWLLYRVIDKHRRTDLLAYAAVTVAALWTYIYCWPLLLTHMIWTSFQIVRSRISSTVFFTQCICVIVSLPVLSLAIFQNPPSRWLEPQWSYLESGHLIFPTQDFFWGTPPELFFQPWILAPLTVTLVFLGQFLPSKAGDVQGIKTENRSIFWPKTICALGAGAVASGLMFIFASSVSEESGPTTRVLLYAVSILPLIGAVMSLVILFFLNLLSAWSPGWVMTIAGMSNIRLSVWLAFLPMALLLLVSIA